MAFTYHQRLDTEFFADMNRDEAGFEAIFDATKELTAIRRTTGEVMAGSWWVASFWT